MSEKVDLRCPVGPQSLLGRMAPMEKAHVTEDNLVELACSDCARTLRKQGKDVLRVLHRFDFLGRLIESEYVPR
jgi:hypothetical protein